MSFIKNIQIWNNQIPRVCNFDILDYCYVGGIGNTCTGNTDVPDTEDGFSTARTSYNAWTKAVNQYFLASISFYYDIGFDDSSVSSIIIPDGFFNDKCNTQENYTKLCDLYYGPNGFIEQTYLFEIKRAQLQNSLLADTDPNKKTGVYTETVLRLVSPFAQPVPYTYSIDYTDYQTPEYSYYEEYREILGELMQRLKKIITATSNSSLTPFAIPDQCVNDVVIGTQTWTSCNLDVETYRNGDPIPQVQDPTAWSNLTTGAWCYYENNTEYGPVFGKLYNWYAVNDPRGLAPVGYHIPTDAEWTVLTNYLGGDTVAGLKMKLEGWSRRECVLPYNSRLWTSPNLDATNKSGFTGLPGGSRDGNGFYSLIGDIGYWWSSTEDGPNDAWYRLLGYDDAGIYRYSNGKVIGMSVRLIKN